MTSRFPGRAAALLLTVFLAGCGNNPRVVAGPEDLTGAEALVLTSTYDKLWLPETLFRKAHWAYNPIYEAWFSRIEPAVDGRVRLNGTHDKVLAFKVPPGKYTFHSVLLRKLDFFFDRPDQQYTFEVAKGEAVYIGDVIFEPHIRPGRYITAINGVPLDKPRPATTFRVYTEDHRDRAKAYFDEALAASGFRFQVRLAKHETFTVPGLQRR